MSVRSTITLTRGEAEGKAVNKMLQGDMRKIARREVSLMNDEELEDYLEEHFYNYTIDEYES